uniref:Immunoglobulin V-set domain-containing protein n=1 Tax=Myripristis murdjan TaxID=586833 RepID=A0A667YZT1_9TELE
MYLLLMKTSSRYTATTDVLCICILQLVGCVSSLEVRAYSGRKVIINCPYSNTAGDRQERKCFYKISENEMGSEDNRSIYNRNNDSFTVTIRELTKTDKGSYWCGAVTQTAEVTYIALITKIILKVQSRYLTCSDTSQTPHQECDEGGCWHLLVWHQYQVDP